MFTGIVQDMGLVTGVDRDDQDATFSIESVLFNRVTTGGSVSVNGACLTAIEISGSSAKFNAITETLERTNLGDVSAGVRVNLELPMSAETMFDGHIVQGHVDGVATITALDAEGDSTRIRLSASPDLLRYVVEKGSITLDGISLTVAALHSDGFEVAIIPHTREVTNLGARASGDRLNVEVDVLAKYVERLLNT